MQWFSALGLRPYYGIGSRMIWFHHLIIKPSMNWIKCVTAGKTWNHAGPWGWGTVVKPLMYCVIHDTLLSLWNYATRLLFVVFITCSLFHFLLYMYCSLFLLCFVQLPIESVTGLLYSHFHACLQYSFCRYCAAAYILVYDSFSYFFGNRGHFTISSLKKESWMNDEDIFPFDRLVA